MFKVLLKLAGVTVTVKGAENIPEDTAVLYVGNHRSYFDILAGYTTVPTLLGFVAKKEMERIPLLRTWMVNVNCLFLDRKNIKEGFKDDPSGEIVKVKNGVSIWIFPGGNEKSERRYHGSSSLKVWELKIAGESGCPVVRCDDRNGGGAGKTLPVYHPVPYYDLLRKTVLCKRIGSRRSETSGCLH